MNKIFLLLLLASTLSIGCQPTPTPTPKYQITGEQSKVIKEMIDAVNEKDANKYVQGFASNVQVFVEAEKKVDGRAPLMLNRATHFKNHPSVRSEIQHLVEIDNKVILHDKVWLNPSDKVGKDIVEIFTFKNGKVVRVDVIQPNDLFE